MGRSKDNKDDIEKIIQRAVHAERLSAERMAKDAYKATECRLYALRDLRERVRDNKERLEEIRQYGPRNRSKDITRFMKTGVRLSPEEIVEAVITDMEAAIAADEFEIETVERALSVIADDTYYLAVTGKYIEGLTDEEIAEKIPCDPTTVWRNRKRLVKRLAVRLYGVEAVK